ncbi:flagellar hook-associated protein 3 FlgL [Rhodovulum imhoffii]|uniref:Flagellar hook-associated protein 3 FlgL n=1 Tax=Rhodovulum imhoffii TaxID=365340 RepID=A0A2T5BRP1_9RHOB|nr:hypothetical protein [Rhodovulum imhoffii]MBK5934061.1 hypothetical protein [Rhodovulum imhoffii]PTN01946.1 flagellar hook-associated protein 3 FlgL [Rhodovulum imhoffii]
MTIRNMGDMAQSFQLRRSSADLRSRLTDLAKEMISTRKSDIGREISGQFEPLADVERGLGLMSSYSTSLASAATLLEAQQAGLSSIRSEIDAIGDSLINARTLDISSLRRIGEEATHRFSGVVSTLNTRIAGQSVFAGRATASPALAPAAEILSAIRDEIAAETTAAGAITRIEAWFNTPGGAFETMALKGSAQPAGPLRLTDTETLTLETTAADPALRDSLRLLATAAILSDPAALGGDTAAQKELAFLMGQSAQGSEERLVGLSAQVGWQEERVETLRTQTGARRTALEITRNVITSADPFETATALKEAEARLDAIFTVTARLSRLSLTEYL